MEEEIAEGKKYFPIHIVTLHIILKKKLKRFLSIYHHYTTQIFVTTYYHGSNPRLRVQRRAICRMQVREKLMVFWSICRIYTKREEIIKRKFILFFTYSNKVQDQKMRMRIRRPNQYSIHIYLVTWGNWWSDRIRKEQLGLI